MTGCRSVNMCVDLSACEGSPLHSSDCLNDCGSSHVYQCGSWLAEVVALWPVSNPELTSEH